MLIIGILTALVASCIDMSVNELSKIKFRLIRRCIHFGLCNLPVYWCWVWNCTVE